MVHGPSKPPFRKHYRHRPNPRSFLGRCSASICRQRTSGYRISATGASCATAKPAKVLPYSDADTVPISVENTPFDETFSNWKCGHKYATARYTPGFPGLSVTEIVAELNGYRALRSGERASSSGVTYC